MLNNLLLLISIFIFIIFLILDGSKKYKRFSPIKIIILPWLFIYLLHLIPLMEEGYYYLDYKVIIYVTISILLFAYPVLVITRKKINNYDFHYHKINSHPKNIEKLNKIFTVLAILAIIGTIIDVIGKIKFYGLNFNMDFYSLRKLVHQWGTLGIERPLYWKIGIIISKFWGLVIILSLFLAEKLNKMNRILALFSLLLPIVLSLSYLGRGALVIMIWIVLVSIILRKSLGLEPLPKLYIVKKFLKILIVSVLIIVLVFFVIRTSYGHKTNINNIMYGFIFRPSPFFSQVLNDLPKPLMIITAITLYYVQSPMYHLSFYWNNIMSSPFWGFSRILPPLVVAQLTKIGLNPYGNVRLIMEKQYSYYHLPYAVFRTGFGALLYDFGIWGSLIFTFLLGKYFAKKYKLYLKNPTLSNIIPIILLSVYSLHSILQNFIIMQDAFFIIIYSLLFAFYIRKRYDILLINLNANNSNSNSENKYYKKSKFYLRASANNKTIKKKTLRG